MIVDGSIQIAKYTLAQWTAWNGILLDGQFSIVSDSANDGVRLKEGDGVTNWLALPFFNPASASGTLAQTLALGNTSSGNHQEMTSNDQMRFGTGNKAYITYTPAAFLGLAFVNNTSAEYMVLKDGGGVDFSGTSVSMASLGFVSGVTSNIQTQLNAKFPTASFTDTAVTSKLITGYVSGSGVVAATDTILQAINKLNGNTTAISGAYVTTVNGASGAITNVALTTGDLSQFAATTSLQLKTLISDETGSGSLVFGTSPTFTTDITTPLIIGGTAVGSTLSLKGTSGVGTSTVAAINFLVGNNGATTAGSWYNSGQLSIGNYASPTAQRLVTIGQDTAWVTIGSQVGLTSQVAFYANRATPNSTSHFLSSDGNNIFINTQDSSNIYFQSGGNTVGNYGSSGGWVFTGRIQTSGAVVGYTVTTPNNTNQTAGANLNKYLINLGSTQFATGSQAALDFMSISQPTVSYVGSSTSTLAAAFSLSGAVNAGTNAIITTSVGLLVKSAAVNGTGTVGTSYGAYINAQTGASTNYALGLNGNLEFGNNFGIFGKDSTGAIKQLLTFTGDNIRILGTLGSTDIYLDPTTTSTGLYIKGNNGRVSIGHATPATKLHVIATTEQLRLGYDTSNYASYTVGSTGSLTVALTGTSPTVTFSNNIKLTQTVTTEALVSDTSVTMVINGTTYKLLARA